MNQPAMFKQVLPLALVFQRWPLSRPAEFAGELFRAC